RAPSPRRRQSPGPRSRPQSQEPREAASKTAHLAVAVVVYRLTYFVGRVHYERSVPRNRLAQRTCCEHDGIEIAVAGSQLELVAFGCEDHEVIGAKWASIWPGKSAALER